VKEERKVSLPAASGEEGDITRREGACNLSPYYVEGGGARRRRGEKGSAVICSVPGRQLSDARKNRPQKREGSSPRKAFLTDKTTLLGGEGGACPFRRKDGYSQWEGGRRKGGIASREIKSGGKEKEKKENLRFRRVGALLREIFLSLDEGGKGGGKMKHYIYHIY